MARRGGTECAFVPLHGWLPWLAAGWRFAGDVARPMAGPHGAWSVFLWRRV